MFGKKNDTTFTGLICCSLKLLRYKFQVFYSTKKPPSNLKWNRARTLKCSLSLTNYWKGNSKLSVSEMVILLLISVKWGVSSELWELIFYFSPWSIRVFFKSTLDIFLLIFCQREREGFSDRSLHGETSLLILWFF